MSKHGFMGNLQRLGKALMTPVAVLPAAALLLRLGADDVFKLKWMSAAGDAIFGNLALIFAIGIAIGFADENNGVAGLAATVGYFVMTKVAGTFNAAINMGVLAGIIAGLLAGFLYNKYKAISFRISSGSLAANASCPSSLRFGAYSSVLPPVTSGH